MLEMAHFRQVPFMHQDYFSSDGGERHQVRMRAGDVEERNDKEEGALRLIRYRLRYALSSPQTSSDGTNRSAEEIGEHLSLRCEDAL